MSDYETYNEETKDKPKNGDKRTFTEEIEMAGNELVDRVKELIKEGNVRRVIIRNANGDLLVEMPLTVGAVAGAGLAVVSLPLAILGVIAAVVARVKVEVVREIPADPGVTEGKVKVEIVDEE